MRVNFTKRPINFDVDARQIRRGAVAWAVTAIVVLVLAWWS